ncbi:hypothetical protein [Marinifilum flexuosum]|uniref:hypothetical protein n=1 Tax=Marinifilum flexuosum TaxID=1117708 RepID=UPI0024948888|nr:hypothetical protein [Marinifilum flexuosum]
MKIKTKKIIAREILILFTSIILLGISYLLRETVRSHKVSQLEEEYNIVTNKIDSIKLNHHLNIQKLWNDLSTNIENFTVPFNTFVEDMNDTIKRKRLFNNLKNGKPNIVYENFSMSYHDFSESIGFTKELTNLQSKQLIKSLELNPLDLGIYANDSFFWYILITYLLIYPMRGLYYILNWSIKTIKS